MKNAATTIEVLAEGQKPRSFRSERSLLRIGFTPRCDLSLEPVAEQGAELLLATGSQGASSLRPTSNPGAFTLNGLPCIDLKPVEPGDVIAIGWYRLIIRNLPMPDHFGAERSERFSGEAPAQPIAAGSSDDQPTVSASGLYADSLLETAGLTQDFLPEHEARPASPDLPENEIEPLPQTQLLEEMWLPPEVQTRAESARLSGVNAAMEAPKPAVPSKPKDNQSHLYLFFVPVAQYLEDDDVAEILINGPRQIYIERRGKLEAVPARFASEQALQAAAMNVAQSVGRFFDKDRPRLDARLPDGSRVHAVMPPLSRAGTTVAIRKFSREKLTIQKLKEFDSISKEGARLLDIIVKLGKNLIVSGATSSGKTSVLNALSAMIPEDQRILVLEDASELQLQQSHTVCFETRKPDEYGKGEVMIRDLLHSALRLRPDRIVVGEIRGGEALDLLQAMNTGHEGSMSTIHANSARDSLLRLETCALLSGIDIPLSALREQVASAVHVVIQTARLHDGSRRITSITEVLGLEEGEYQLANLLIFKEDGSSQGKIKGQHVFVERKPSFLDVARRRGFDMPGVFVS